MGVKFDRILDGFDGPFEKLNGLQKPAPGKVTTAAAGGLHVQPRGQRFVHGDQPAAGGRRGRVLGDVGAAAGRVLRRAEGRRPRAAVGKIAADLGAQLRRRRGEAGRRRHQAAQGPHRAGRSVRRLDALGLDALAARAVRVPVRGRVPAGARRRQPGEPVRRDHLPVGRRAVAGWRCGRGGARRRRWRRRGGGRARRRPRRRASRREYPEPGRGRTRRPRPCRSSRSSSRTAARSSRVGPLGDDLARAASACRSTNHLVERSPDGDQRPLPSEKYYVPGSVLRVAVDTTAPLAHGMTNPLDVFFDNSPVFRSSPTRRRRACGRSRGSTARRRCAAAGPTARATCEDGVAVVEATVGKGTAASCSARRSRSARSRTARSSSCSTGSILRRDARRGRGDRQRRARPVCSRPNRKSRVALVAARLLFLLDGMEERASAALPGLPLAFETFFVAF